MILVWIVYTAYHSMPIPKVQYRQLGKSGLRVSVPIVSQRHNMHHPSTLTIRVYHLIAGSDELWFTKMECTYALHRSVR